MFYSQFILAKKGPLGTVWIAAHLERKLRRNHINDTNIIASVDSILFPEVPIALRLSGHLLLGVVRVYSRKVNYLLSDCSEALLKLKQAFQKSSVDLPPDAATAPFHSITLPETFDFDVLDGYQLHENIGHTLPDDADHHVTTRDLITLQDQDSHHFDTLFTLYDRFPEGGDPYSVLGTNDENQHHSNKKLSGVPFFQDSAATPVLDEDVLPPLPMDEEMDLNICMHKGNPTSGFEIGNRDAGDLGVGPMQSLDQEDELRQSDLFKGSTDQILLTSPAEHVYEVEQVEEVPDIERLRSAVNGIEQDQFYMGIGEDFDINKEVSAEIVTKENPQNIAETNELRHHVLEDSDILKQETPVPITLSPTSIRSFDRIPAGDDMLASILGVRETPVLRVVDTPEIPDLSVMKNGKRKRKTIYDQRLVLSSDLVKQQLAYVDDIRRVRRKAPCTEKDVERLIREKYLEQMCIGPLVVGICANLKNLYTRVVAEKSDPALERPRRAPFNRTAETESRQAQNHLDGDEIILEVVLDMNDLSIFADAASPLAQHLEESHQGKSAELETSALPEVNVAQVSEAPAEDFFQNKTYAVNGSNEAVAAEQIPVVFEELRNKAIQQEKECCEAEMNIKPSDIEISSMIEPNLAGGGLQREDEDQVLHVPSSEIDGVAPAFSPAFVEDDVSHVGSDDKVFLAMDEDEMLDKSNVDNQKRKKTAAENGTWSTRARAVAQYLKMTFDKMGASSNLQSAKLNLNQLVAGRTRKEAARLFFETLVLKSKEYVHVEQETGFSDVFLFPTALLKRVF